MIKVVVSPMVADPKMSRPTDPELPEGPLDGEGFILAGGKSGRLGRDKAFLRYRGSPLIELARRCLVSAGLSVTVVADSRERFRSLGLPVVVDRVSGAGPLGAVFTALTASRSQDNYFIPCDTPLVAPRLYRILARAGRDFDVVVPRDAAGGLHPLCAYYSRTAADPIRRLLETGARRVDSVLEAEDLRVHVLPAVEWKLPDEGFLNVNTPADWELLQRKMD